MDKEKLRLQARLAMKYALALREAAYCVSQSQNQQLSPRERKAAENAIDPALLKVENTEWQMTQAWWRK